ncbi:type VI secretion system tip protein TssI/VgrG [Xenophilus aerolatus]|nr:type VI secretion system tip protein TssI/VgrG [Xenophilus aerolatus]
MGALQDKRRIARIHADVASADSHYAIDAESLSLGKLVLASAAGIFADGTPFDAPGQTPPPAPLNLDLDAFIGRDITCFIELDGAGEFIPGAVDASTDRVGAGVREISALITDAQLWGEEGRHVQYKLTLRPWLHLATLSTDCKIFQNRSVVDILDELLADYPFPVDKRLIDTYPARDYQTQYNETDFQFFERLCQEWGINYFFEHSDGKHRLVLIDNMGAHRANPSEAYAQVEYHPPHWKVDAEYIHAFAPHNQLTSGRYATRDYDYTRPKADLTVSRNDPRPTGQAEGEVYQWHHGGAGSQYAQPGAGAAQGNDPHEEGRHLARLRMQQLRTHGARAQASGHLRGMVPGCTFRLQKHPRKKANGEYLVLDTRFLIEEVGRDSQNVDAVAGRRQQWRAQVDFTAHPVAEPLRPAFTRQKPYTRGPEVAVVVGPEGENIWTDALGRIKVQFPWDRIGRRDQNSTCWLRVSSPWAGNQLGGMHLPRIGQEVVVDFISGDPDLPLCLGRVYNQLNLPPWALPNQQALSGFRSRELTEGGGGNGAGGRGNHLVLDDTDKKIQAQLKSDHQHSQLSLGSIARIEDNAGRKDPRGQGFELRTDGHGALRAADGLLITTEARHGARQHMLDSEETASRLAQGQDQHDSLASAARQAEAQEAGDQHDVAAALKAQNDDIKGKGGDRAANEFPELLAPHLVLSSPAGIESTTPKSTHVASGDHIALTSGAHTSVSAGKSFLVSVKQAIRLFVYKGVIRIVAALDNIYIEAQKQGIHLRAKEEITLRAKRIVLEADEFVKVNGGTSYGNWNSSGIVNGTNGTWLEHAAVHSFAGPDSLPLPAIRFPEPKDSTVCKECLLKAMAAGSAFAKA